MPEAILPGVYIEVRSEGLITPGRVTVGNLGVVGTASKGPIGVPTLLGSYTEALDIFGPYDAWKDGNSNELTLNRALELAFSHGASAVFAVRVARDSAPGNPPVSAAQATFAVEGAAPGNVAANLQALTPGTWGNDLEINVHDAEDVALIEGEEHAGPGPIQLDRSPVEQSSLNSIQVRQGATGQTKTLNVVYPPDAAAAGTVQITPATGDLAFDAADDPVAGDTVVATYAVPQANSVKVTLRYGSQGETFTAADGAHLVQQLTAAGGSALVSATDGANAADAPAKFSAVDDFRKFGRGTDTPGSDGADASDGDIKAGFDLLLNEQAHIMVAAGVDHTRIAAELTQHVEKASTDQYRAERIGIVGSKVNADFNSVRGHNVNSERMVFVAPGVRANDAAKAEEVELPGSYTAAIIAGMLSSRDPHISLTNKPVAVEPLPLRFTQPQLEQLVQSRVLALEEQRGRGIRVVKAITSSTNSAFHQITTRRIVDFAKFGVRSAAQPYIGRLNNERVRAALKSTIISFLQSMLDREMLVSFEAEVTATRQQEIKGEVAVTLIVRPTFSIDFIQVTMILG